MFQDRIINNGIKTLNIPWWVDLAMISVFVLPFFVFGVICPKLISIFIKRKLLAVILIIIGCLLNIIAFIWFSLLNLSIDYKPDLYVGIYLITIVSILILWNIWLVKKIYKK